MNRHLLIPVLTQTAVGGLFINLAPVTPHLIRELGATYGDVGMVTTLFILGQVLAGLLAGYFSDRFGVKRIYVAANICTVLLAVLLAGAQTIQQILFLRFFLGFAMGTQFVVGSSYLAFWSPPEKTALYQGIYGGGFNFGIALSFFLAAPQVSWLGWRGVYLVPGVACFLSTLYLCVAGREPAEKPSGQALSPRDFRRLPIQPLVLLGVGMTAAWATFIVLGAWLTEYLMVAQRSAFWLSSVLTGINVAGSGIGRILGGAVARPGRETRAVLWFYFIVIAAAAALLFSSSVIVILTLAALVAMVSSMGFAPLMRLAIQVGGPRLQGTAVGLVLALGMLIGSVLPTLFGWVVGVTGSFTMGFLVVLAAPLTGFLAMLRFQSRCAPEQKNL